MKIWIYVYGSRNQISIRLERRGFYNLIHQFWKHGEEDIITHISESHCRVNLSDQDIIGKKL